MTDNSRKITDLPTINSITDADYIVVLAQANTANAHTAIIKVSDFISSLNIQIGDL